MFFNSIKEINRLLSKGMSNIYLKLTIEKADAIKIKDHLRVEWERIIASDNELYNEWQRVTKNDNEWCNNWQGVIRRVRNKEWQRVATSDNEWQRMTASGTTSKCK